MTTVKVNPGNSTPIEDIFHSCITEGANAPTPAEGAKVALRCFLLRLGAMAATADPNSVAAAAGEAKQSEGGKGASPAPVLRA